MTPTKERKRDAAEIREETSKPKRKRREVDDDMTMTMRQDLQNLKRREEKWMTMTKRMTGTVIDH